MAACYGELFQATASWNGLLGARLERRAGSREVVAAGWNRGWPGAIEGCAMGVLQALHRVPCMAMRPEGSQNGALETCSLPLHTCRSVLSIAEHSRHHGEEAAPPRATPCHAGWLRPAPLPCKAAHRHGSPRCGASSRWQAVQRPWQRDHQRHRRQQQQTVPGSLQHGQRKHSSCCSTGAGRSATLQVTPRRRRSALTVRPPAPSLPLPGRRRPPL